MESICESNQTENLEQLENVTGVQMCEASSDVKHQKNQGMAQIKSEYLVINHVRQLNLDYVASQDKTKLLHSIDKNNDEINNEPPRKKLKGQNKNRPHDTRLPRAEKLCLKVLSDEGCPYGDSCCYSHDIASFIAKKPIDLGSKCYLFETFGKCPYGVICRFASQHLTSDNKNIVDEGLWAKFKDVRNVLNSLSKDLQILLRKRTYNFAKSDHVLKMIKNGTYKQLLIKPNEKQNGSSKDSSSSECKDSKLLKEPTSAENEKGVNVSSKNFSAENPSYSNEKQKEEKNEMEQTDGKALYVKLLGSASEDDLIRLKQSEKKKIDFRDKLYLAPLTTVGNLPYRRICKEFGADITCGEMAMAQNILQGQQSEWALLKRHSSEDIFGVQLCAPHADLMTHCCQVLMEKTEIDFVDINMGCPINIVYKKGSGCGLMGRIRKLEEMVFGMSSVLNVPLTVKMRTGIYENKNIADNVIKQIHTWGDRVSLITLHGRSREQRYTKLADWNYVDYCADLAHPIPLFGCGDVLSYEDVMLHKQKTKVAGIMFARGALIKPWIFTEVKEQRHWDISSQERFDIIKRYVNYGLEHWGSDTEGVEKTRRFLLEWLSFLYRYIPVGILERFPVLINERPPPYKGRDDLETMMGSPSCADWIKISEMLLGPVPENFVFLPKHKANAYQ